MEKSREPLPSTKDRGRGPVLPEVIVDFIFEGETIFIAVKNIGRRPLNFMHASFKPAIFGLGGTEAIGKLPVFNREYFLAPGKEIRTLVDSSRAYFARKQPTHITVTVVYRDFRDREFRIVLEHDLEVYQKLITHIPRED